MRKILTAISTLTLLALAKPVTADSTDSATPVNFADLDTNADLYIDNEEFEQFRVNKRGKTREESQEGRRGGKGGGDRAAQLFDEADADGDGMLNEFEFAALQEAVRAKREEMRQRRADRG